MKKNATQGAIKAEKTTALQTALLAGGLTALLPASMVFAQSESSSGILEEIVVTAQKRQENAQDVPIAITSLSSDDVAAAGIKGTDDLRASVPALNVTRGAGGFGLPRIRGVGATGQGNGIENPVAIYVDGVYYAAASGVLQSLFDVEQVTVLKGPQGTLFGRNATGGLIQISTRNPSLTETRGKVQLGYGNFDTTSAGGFFSTPLTDSLAFSISGQYENREEGFGKNVFTGNDVQDTRTFASRAKLLFKPSDATSILLSADVNGTDDSAPAFVTFSNNTLGQNVPAVISASGGDPDYDIYADVDPELRARQWGTSLTIEQDIGATTLKSITAYRNTELSTYFDPDGTVNPSLRILNENLDKNFTQEINLLSDDSSKFKWVLGAFYMTNDSGQEPGRTTGTTQFGGNGYTDNFNDVKLKSLSGFFEGTYALSASTNVTAGGRYTSDTRTMNATSVAFNGNTSTTTTTVFPERERDFKKPSWKLSIDHRFSEQLMMYASYNRGFRAGTFVPQATPVIVLEPEVLDAYEIGLKSDLLDRRLRINLAGYYFDQSAVQVMQVIAGEQNVYSARDGAKIYGVDGDITMQVTDNLRVFGGFGWNHARYKSFTDAIIAVPFPVPGTTPPFSTTQYSYIDSATGQTAVNTTCLGTFLPPGITTQAARDAFYRGRLGGNCLLRGDASGNRLQNSPDITASIGFNFDIPLNIGTFSLAGSVYYNDGYVGTPDERVEQEGFTTVNTSVTWKNPKENLSVRLWGNNVTDEFYRTQISATNSGDNGTAGAPRTFGLTLGLEY